MAEPSAAKRFWAKLENEATDDSMMLNKKAKVIGPVEKEEILSLVPPRAGLDILELAAGIGRFTTTIAQEGAKSVIAVDLIQGFCDTNKEANASNSNVEVRCADVKDFDLPHGSVDLVFSNWLFMYLSDADVAASFSKITQWLRPGGHFFLRESCDKPSSTTVISDMGENPTVYRKKEDYDRMLGELGLTVEKSGVVQAYVEYENLTNQKYWLLRKAGSEQ